MPTDINNLIFIIYYFDNECRLLNTQKHIIKWLRLSLQQMTLRDEFQYQHLEAQRL